MHTHALLCVESGVLLFLIQETVLAFLRWVLCFLRLNFRDLVRIWAVLCRLTEVGRYNVITVSCRNTSTYEEGVNILLNGVRDCLSRLCSVLLATFNGCFILYCLRMLTRALRCRIGHGKLFLHFRNSPRCLFYRERISVTIPRCEVDRRKISGAFRFTCAITRVL